MICFSILLSQGVYTDSFRSVSLFDNDSTAVDNTVSYLSQISQIFLQAILSDDMFLYQTTITHVTSQVYFTIGYHIYEKIKVISHTGFSFNKETKNETICFPL